MSDKATGVLDKPTTQRRFSLTTGLSSSVPTDGRVDRTGGKFSAGLIRGVSVLTRGEALGHGFWCDAHMLDQVVVAMQQLADKGLKCRFTHPGLCADGLAKKLGVLLNPRRVDDQVLADLHLNTFAHRGPDGNLAEYVMDRADEEPEYFGTSIVFVSDYRAEEDFLLANGGEWVEHSDGWGVYETIEGFESPDQDNKDNLPHARIAELLACDVVDDPAANPGGMFHRDLSAVNGADQYLEYVFGMSEIHPPAASFGVDPDRARQFLSQWVTQRGLSFLLKGKPVLKFNSLFARKKLAAGDSPSVKPDEKAADTTQNPPAEKTGDDSKQEPVVPDENGMVTCPKCSNKFEVEASAEADPVSDESQSPADYAAAHGKYVAAFGADNGTKWFLGKVTFPEAQKLHYGEQLAAKDREIASLQTQLKSANDRLAFFANEGADALKSSPASKGTEGGSSGSVGFASLFKVPGGSAGSN